MEVGNGLLEFVCGGMMSVPVGTDVGGAGVLVDDNTGSELDQLLSSSSKPIHDLTLRP